MSEEINITFAINALENLRKTPYVDSITKDFTHVVEEIIKSLKWEEFKEYGEFHCVLIYALEEWDKKIQYSNPNGCEMAFIVIRNNIKKMLTDLNTWSNYVSENES